MRELVSLPESSFLLSALESGIRCDGRKILDYRALRISFGQRFGRAEVQLGRTRVIGVASASLEEPDPIRANEGSLSFHVNISPMCSPFVESARQSESSVELARLVERSVRGSRAIDVEALCIISGRSVWSIRVDLHVVDYGGNLYDATVLAAIASLLHFRKPEVVIDGQKVVVLEETERDPVPLSVHHIPVSVTFAFFHSGDVTIVDPTEREEQVMDGYMVLAVNTHKEICAVHKGGGVSIDVSTFRTCVQVAIAKAEFLTSSLREALLSDSQNRENLLKERFKYADYNTPIDIAIDKLLANSVPNGDENTSFLSKSADADIFDVLKVRDALDAGTVHALVVAQDVDTPDESDIILEEEGEEEEEYDDDILGHLEEIAGVGALDSNVSSSLFAEMDSMASELKSSAFVNRSSAVHSSMAMTDDCLSNSLPKVVATNKNITKQETSSYMSTSFPSQESSVSSSGRGGNSLDSRRSRGRGFSRGRTRGMIR